MSRHVPRIFINQALQTGLDITLEDRQAHHLLNVLRVRNGDAVCLFNGQGGEYPSRVIDTQRHAVTINIGNHSAAGRESPLAITLGQGIARGERMDFAIQKAVELGVACIQPLHTEKSQRLPPDRLSRKLEHWRSVACSAAEQSGRTRVPTVQEPSSLVEWLEQCRNDESCERKLVLDPASGTRPGSLPAAQRACLLIGPEAGLAESELESAGKCGFQAISLGPRILRTETAGVTAIAALQALWGDLG